jgi:alkanesulfonate monooxygenase SsuD/methylene tetrahydromethanopterin reductase-like flavin-dependent oxidoreductase (luciferase family)
MSKKLSFGIISLPRNSWDEEVRRWKHVEKLGFDSVWMADHFCRYDQPTQPWFEGWTILSALANVTKTINIGTLVTSMFLRYPPMLARQAMTVDHISNGRLILGLGTGLPGTVEFPMVGIPDYSPAVRVDRFREAVEIVDKLLRVHTVQKFEGEYYQLIDSNVYPAPKQIPRPPIMIAAMGDKMLQIAAEYADIWNSYGGRGLNPEDMFNVTQKRLEKLEAYCDGLGRNFEEIKKSILIYGEEAFSIFDSVENFVKYVEKYSEAGFEEFIFYYPGKTELQEVLELVAKEVLLTFR